MRFWTAIGCSLLVAGSVAWGTLAAAQESTGEAVDQSGDGDAPTEDPPTGDLSAVGTQLLEVRFRPTRIAQIAVWIEDESGEFLTTLGLTEATARRGIGNRPGASQMNSGFRWPYGRREGALPTWAYRRAQAEDAEPFRRVIFQDRTSEGLASRTAFDFSADDYYCLSFDRQHADKEALDAVSCASPFNSDKGRFITEADVSAGYAEPFEDLTTGEGRMEPLSVHSLYPPRMDVKDCGGGGSCYDHPDAVTFADHARDVMPEIDAVTMPTPQGDMDKRILYNIPNDWEPGTYRTCVEINVEGDYNDTYNGDVLPTPKTPSSAWDYWAKDYGYAYRGQPAVVYCTEFELGMDGLATFSTDTPEGSVSTWDTTAPDYGVLYGMQGMTDDPEGAPGVGADRLRKMEDGARLEVIVSPPLSCEDNQGPGDVPDVRLGPHSEVLHAHEWAMLSFPAADDDRGIFGYDVRVSTDPIEDEETFMRAERAKDATIEAQELVVPTDHSAGEMVQVEIGGLTQSTQYYVAVRAVDECAETGDFTVTEYQTPVRTFTTVTPCFVATAAYGSPLASEISVLRRVRDRHLLNHPIGRALVDAYYAFGPSVATLIAEHDSLRAAARWALTPVVWLADAFDL